VEILMPVAEIQWDQFMNFGIIAGCMILLMGILIFYINQKKKKGEPVTQNQIYMTFALIFAFSVFLIIYASTLFKDILYAIDISNGNYNEDIIYVMDADYTRAWCELEDQNEKKYIFQNYDLTTSQYREIYIELENNYIGKKCEIEYFKLSKYIIRVTILD